MSSKSVFKVKYHQDRLVAKYKVKLVAQRYSQISNINFNEIFIPTI